jgi:RNA polymerase-binding transcription factor DksA
VECGGEIGAKRLAAVPWTERCVGCQARAEQHCEAPPAVAFLPDSERNAA